MRKTVKQYLLNKANGKPLSALDGKALAKKLHKELDDILNCSIGANPVLKIKLPAGTSYGGVSSLANGDYTCPRTTSGGGVQDSEYAFGEVDPYIRVWARDVPTGKRILCKVVADKSSWEKPDRVRKSRAKKAPKTITMNVDLGRAMGFPAAMLKPIPYVKQSAEKIRESQKLLDDLLEDHVKRTNRKSGDTGAEKPLPAKPSVPVPLEEQLLKAQVDYLKTDGGASAHNDLSDAQNNAYDVQFYKSFKGLKPYLLNQIINSRARRGLLLVTGDGIHKELLDLTGTRRNQERCRLLTLALKASMRPELMQRINKMQDEGRCCAFGSDFRIAVHDNTHTADGVTECRQLQEAVRVAFEAEAQMSKCKGI